MISEYRLKRRVQFYETDTAGIVHFSCFYRYMEEAEHALWRAAGLSIAPPDAAVGFPRVAASFDFHRPLRFEEEFEVLIRIAAIGARSIPLHGARHEGRRRRRHRQPHDRVRLQGGRCAAAFRRRFRRRSPADSRSRRRPRNA